MIPIIIAIVFSVIGSILFHIVKNGAQYSNVKYAVALFCALSPPIALIGLLFWTVDIELGEYNYIMEQNVVINKEILTARLDKYVSPELIEKVDKYNNLCERHFEVYQASYKWSILGKFRKSALDYELSFTEV